MPEQSLDEFATTENLRATIRRLQGQVAEAKAKSTDLVNAVYQAARDAAEGYGPAPAVIIPAKDQRRKPEVALVHCTDLQYGKKTESYDRLKCEQRVAKLAERICRLTDIQRSDHPVNECHLMLGGDFVESLNIFPGQAYEVDGFLFDQMFGVARITENLVRSLLSHFSRVEVWQEEGNHGRIGLKGDWPKTDNTDLMVYEIARLALQAERRLTWHPRLSYFQHVRIGNYQAGLIHGDEIKSFGGNTPVFGLLRKGTAWTSGVWPSGIRDIWFGHFHTHMTLTLPNGGHMYGSGSTESDNIHAAEFVAAKGIPSQRLSFVEPEAGRITAEFQVYLDD